MIAYYTNSDRNEIVWLEDAEDYQYQNFMDGLEDNGETELLDAIENGRESVLEAYHIERDNDGLWHIVDPSWRPDFHIAESSHWFDQNLETAGYSLPTPLCQIDGGCTYNGCLNNN